MHSIEYILIGSIISITVIVAVLEVISFVVRRAGKAAGAGSVVLRDIGVYIRIIELALIAFSVLQISGLSSIFTTLTVSGIAALALSLALQSTLSNVISGILLASDGVIHLGDSVEYSGVKGTIVRIALRNTWIKQQDGSIAVVSNSSLSSGPLVNHSGAERLKRKYAID